MARAEILLSGDDHGRRFDLPDEGDGRVFQVMFDIIPGETGEMVVDRHACDVASEDFAVPVDRSIERRSSPEPVGFSDTPAGEDASAASPRDEDTVFVDDRCRWGPVRTGRCRWQRGQALGLEGTGAEKAIHWPSGDQVMPFGGYNRLVSTTACLAFIHRL